MKGLLFRLLKLIVQLVLLAATGTWFKLDREAPTPASRTRPKKRTFSPTRPPREAVPPRRRGPMPVLLDGDEPEGGELVLRGGELASESDVREARARARRRARPSTRTAAPAEALPLRRALRDPRVVREAMVLGIALGRRPARR